MLLIYGDLMPVRLLEEIQFWKNQELEHANMISQLIPDLEPEYAQVLSEWEQVFQKTEETARGWLTSVSKNRQLPEPNMIEQIELLLKASVYQSEQFVQQLEYMRQYSKAVQDTSAASIMISHIARESYVFVSLVHGITNVPLASISAHPPEQPTGPQAHIHAMSAPVSAFDNHGPNGPQDAHLAPSPVQPNAGSPGIRAMIGNLKPQEEAVHRSFPPSPYSEQANLGTGNIPPYSASSAYVTPAASIAKAEQRQEQTDVKVEAGRLDPHRSGGTSPPSRTVPNKPQQDTAYVPPGGHRLPPLPYAYQALEPYIDETTMRIHHDKHHQSYVDGLNKAELALAEARRTGGFERIKALEGELAFNGAGHYLHTIFWEIMNPKGGRMPEGELRSMIERDFGSYDAFKQQFSKAAETVEGSGWAILVWSPRSRRLEILQAEKHQNLSQWDIVPLLPLDVWEHAYYLKHQNKRADYVRDWWNVVYWPKVNERYLKARELKWTPF